MSRILIIDDNKDLCAALGTALNRAGYEVSQVQGAKLGLKLYRETKFDLILSDILMPDTDGLELIFALRKTDPNVPIIAMSGGGHGSAEHYLHVAGVSGASAVIRKPFSPQELIELIEIQLASPESLGLS